MADTWSWVPDYGSRAEVSPRIRKVGFGDGYGQSVPDGINTMPVVRSVSFSSRDSLEIAAMDAFLRAQGGVKWFWFTYPGAATIKVKCEKWEVVPVAANLESLSCVFEQVFSPGV